MKRAIIVNGVPASGKSTVAQPLAQRLGVPYLELDAIKEVLFEELGHRDADRDWGRALGRASLNVIWAVLAGLPPDSTTVVDAWLRLPPHDHIVAGLERSGVDGWVEVWCHAEIELLVARYAARVRHPGHPAAADYLDELRELASTARPAALTSVLDVDTGNTEGIDVERIASWVKSQLGLT